MFIPPWADNSFFDVKNLDFFRLFYCSCWIPLFRDFRLAFVSSLFTSKSLHLEPPHEPKHLQEDLHEPAELLIHEHRKLYLRVLLCDFVLTPHLHGRKSLSRVVSVPCVEPGSFSFAVNIVVGVSLWLTRVS